MCVLYLGSILKLTPFVLLVIMHLAQGHLESDDVTLPQ